MKNFVMSKVSATTNHVKRQKWAYLWGGVAVCAFALLQNATKEFNEFLVEEGIDPMKYYNPEHYEELQKEGSPDKG